MPTLFLPMLVGWCGLWAALSGVALIRAAAHPDRIRSTAVDGFWSMTLFWVAIDLGIAAWALLAPVTEVEEFRTLLLINGGLDVLYIGTGILLVTRAAALVRGFGVAILIQGGFLLVLDLGWWWILASSGS